MSPFSSDIAEVWFRDSAGNVQDVVSSQSNPAQYFPNGILKFRITGKPFQALLKVNKNPGVQPLNLRILVNNQIKKDTTIPYCSSYTVQMEYEIQ